MGSEVYDCNWDVRLEKRSSDLHVIAVVEFMMDVFTTLHISSSGQAGQHSGSPLGWGKQESVHACMHGIDRNVFLYIPLENMDGWMGWVTRNFFYGFIFQ
jgi:hypothetical protein